MGRAAIFGERKHRPTVGNYTRRQADVLAYLWDFYRQNDQLPPCHAIAAHFSFASMNAAQNHLEALHRRGWLERNEVGKWKFAQSKREAIRELCNLQALEPQEQRPRDGTPSAGDLQPRPKVGIPSSAVNVPKAPGSCAGRGGCTCEVAETVKERQ